VRERVLLDLVDQAARLAARGYQVVPAPGREVSPLLADTRDIGGQRVQPAEVVEEPPVDAVGREGCLNRADVQSDRLGRGHPDQYSRTL
jgi:hypothetical protein